VGYIIKGDSSSGPLVDERTSRRSEPFDRPRPLGGPMTRRPRAGLPEPPPLRVPVLGSAARCASCSAAVPEKASPALCWGCGRRLCVDCYWRHGLTPAAHRCTSCLTRYPEDKVTISGGRSLAPTGFSGRA